MKIKHIRKTKVLKHVPLWKWVVIILLVIAMPLFFSYARNIQMQQALMSTTLPSEETDKQIHNQQEKTSGALKQNY